MCQIRFGIDGISFENLQPCRPPEEAYRPLVSTLPSVVSESSAAEGHSPHGLETQLVGKIGPPLIRHNRERTVDDTGPPAPVIRYNKRPAGKLADTIMESSVSSRPHNAKNNTRFERISTRDNVARPQYIKRVRFAKQQLPVKRVTFADMVEEMEAREEAADDTSSSDSDSSYDSYTDPPPILPHNRFGWEDDGIRGFPSPSSSRGISPDTLNALRGMFADRAPKEFKNASLSSDATSGSKVDSNVSEDGQNHEATRISKQNSQSPGDSGKLTHKDKRQSRKSSSESISVFESSSKSSKHRSDEQNSSPDAREHSGSKETSDAKQKSQSPLHSTKSSHEEKRRLRESIPDPVFVVEPGSEGNTRGSNEKDSSPDVREKKGSKDKKKGKSPGKKIAPSSAAQESASKEESMEDKSAKGKKKTKPSSSKHKSAPLVDPAQYGLRYDPDRDVYYRDV